MEKVSSYHPSLIDVYVNHLRLGEDGKKKDKVNRFGDTALRADVEAEELILSSLKKYSEASKIDIIYQGEEMGTGKIVTKNPSKTIFTTFDGLDGSSNYLNLKDWSYGTMIAVAENEDPTYNDFKLAGILLMEEGLMILGIKSVGVFVHDLNKKESKQLQNFDKDEKFDNSKTLANKYFPEEMEAYGDKPWLMTGSTAASISAICIGNQIRNEKYPAMNNGWNGLIEVTRKNNLEQPTLYLLATELDGVMVDKNGKSIGNQKFTKWGQKNADGSEDRQIIVTAKNKSIASEMISRINILSK